MSRERDFLYAESLKAALEQIAGRGIYPVNGGAACATCTAFWGSDSKFQEEHHYKRCAYVIARAALAECNPEIPSETTP